MKKPLISILIITVVSIIVYGNSLKNGFVLDDKYIIESNRTIRSLNNIPGFFIAGYWAGTRYEKESSSLYRPLVITTYAIDYSIWKLKPFGYHLENLIIHTINGLLIFYIVLVILDKKQWPALIVSLLFITHPVHVEAVAGVVGRAELLAALFFLSSFCCYAGNRKLQGSSTGYIVSSVFFGFALLCKETALVLPGIIILYDLYRFKDIKELKKNTVRYAGYLMMIVLYFIIRYAALGEFFSSAGKGIFYKQTVQARFLTMFRVFVDYIKMLFYPAGLKADYTDYTYSLVLGYGVIISILIFITAIIIFLVSYRKNKVVFFSAGWYLICLLPVSNIIPFGAVMAERLLYLPSIGYCIGLVLLAMEGVSDNRRKQLYSGFFIILIMLFSAGTIKYNSRWFSNDTLWEYAVKKTPGNARVHYAVGVVELDKGNYDKAIKEFESSLKMDSDIPEAYNNLAVCYNNKKMYDAAIIMTNRAIQHKSDYYEAYINMGNAYNNKGSLKEAIESYNKAVAINPASTDAHYNVGLLLYTTGRKDEALKEFIKTISYDSYYESAWLGISALYMEKADLKTAVNELMKAAAYLPESPAIHDRLGLAYYENGEYMKAMAEFEKSIKLNPGDAYVHNRLGSAYGNMGKYNEALAEFKKAVDIAPGYAEAKENYSKLENYLRNKK